MRFVPTEQQSCLMLHRTRNLFIRQQTAAINSIRAHLAEFGIVAALGRRGVTELLNIVADQKLPIWAQLFGLDWARSETALKRRQGAARQHQ